MATIRPSKDTRPRMSIRPLISKPALKLGSCADSEKALTISILLGWTSYVVSLSQAGKHSPLNALGDAIKGVGNGDSGMISGQRGLGVFQAMAGGMSRSPAQSPPPSYYNGLADHGVATAIYTITFGVLGFIPAPSVRRRD